MLAFLTQEVNGKGFEVVLNKEADRTFSHLTLPQFNTSCLHYMRDCKLLYG